MTNSSVHSIRLAGPWEVSTSAETQKRVKMPANWNEIFEHHPTKATFKRSFNTPTGIKNQLLYLCAELVNCSGSLSLNQTELAQFQIGSDVSQQRWEITELIQKFNTLEFSLTPNVEANSPTGLCSVVTLEIVESE